MMYGEVNDMEVTWDSRDIHQTWSAYACELPAGTANILAPEVIGEEDLNHGGSREEIVRQWCIPTCSQWSTHTIPS